MPCRLPVGDVKPTSPCLSFPAQFPLDDDYVTAALADFNRNPGPKRKFIELLPSEQSQVLLAAQRIKASDHQRRPPDGNAGGGTRHPFQRLWFRRSAQLSLPFGASGGLSGFGKRCLTSVSHFFSLLHRFGVRP